MATAFLGVGNDCWWNSNRVPTRDFPAVRAEEDPDWVGELQPLCPIPPLPSVPDSPREKISIG